jgi:hypothetical protein
MPVAPTKRRHVDHIATDVAHGPLPLRDAPWAVVRCGMRCSNSLSSSITNAMSACDNIVDRGTRRDMETLLTSARNLAQTRRGSAVRLTVRKPAARFRRLLSAFTLAGAGATAPLVVARKAAVAIPADGAHRSTGRAARTATATGLARLAEPYYLRRKWSDGFLE